MGRKWAGEWWSVGGRLGLPMETIIAAQTNLFPPSSTSHQVIVLVCGLPPSRDSYQRFNLDNYLTMSSAILEAVETAAQNCLGRCPVIILGSGASAPYGVPGMGGLKDHLKALPSPNFVQPMDAGAWNTFTQNLESLDLEAALDATPKSEAITQHVVEATWDYLVPNDRRVFQEVIKDRRHLALTSLYQFLLRSTARRIHVVTPNYDRLAEYAADAGNIRWNTGFEDGYLRSRRSSASLVPGSTSQERIVNVWKVHGSFDWFRDPQNVVVSLPSLVNRTEELTPVIVTPGIEKYRLTHDEPFTSIKMEADRAIQAAAGYFCIGYGFNDAHLQAKLTERCRSEAVPLVMITRSLTASARAFIASGGATDYMAIEQSSKGAKVYLPSEPEGIELDGSDAWQLHSFLHLVSP